MHAGARDITIERRSVRFVDAAGAAHSVAADQVIVAMGAHGDVLLAERLRGEGFAVETVGDCNGIDYIDGAIRGAAQAAARLAG